mgnify:CR=1 FL=1
MSIFDMSKLKDKAPEEDNKDIVPGENKDTGNVEEDADIELKGNISDVFTDMLYSMYPNLVVKKDDENSVAAEGMAGSISPEVIDKAEQKKKMKIYVTSVEEIRELGLLEATNKLKDISPSSIDSLYIENVEHEDDLSPTAVTYVDYAKGKGFNVLLTPEQLPKSP